MLSKQFAGGHVGHEIILALQNNNDVCFDLYMPDLVLVLVHFQDTRA